jgi:hypothetical protein
VQLYSLLCRYHGQPSAASRLRWRSTASLSWLSHPISRRHLHPRTRIWRRRGSSLRSEEMSGRPKSSGWRTCRASMLLVVSPPSRGICRVWSMSFSVTSRSRCFHTLCRPHSGGRPGVGMQAAPARTHGATVAPQTLRVKHELWLQVTNLHIRYEDHVTRPGSNFACGMTLHSMAAFTVDDAGNEMFVKKAAMALLRKAATLSRFSVYFDTRTLLVVEPRCSPGPSMMFGVSPLDTSVVYPRNI